VGQRLVGRARTTRGTLGSALAASLALACSDSAPTGATSPLVEEGRRVYQNVCVACHSGDPNQDGALGPAIAGSSRELIEARVLRAEYPPGYTPKRAGNVMPRFEFLKDQIDALTAYLAYAKNAAPAAERPPTE
jgi:mono/diheme cytochrome c family protein